MIKEYALEPELVATWGTLSNFRLYLCSFGLGQGRIVSRYPENWAEIVKSHSLNKKDMEQKRLVELLKQLKETMVKRTNCCWDDGGNSWTENVLQENTRYPFFAIMVRNNPEGCPEILAETDLADVSQIKWYVPHGRIIPRKAKDMASAIGMMLSRCRWVKFIDPYILLDRSNYWPSLEAFINILGKERPFDPPVQIEIHALSNDKEPSLAYLAKKFEKILKNGLSLILIRWKEKIDGQRFHNRYVLTDLGGVSFHHGLDIGADGETDDITLLDRKQYEIHCSQYDIHGITFDLAESSIQITGSR